MPVPCACVCAHTKINHHSRLPINRNGFQSSPNRPGWLERKEFLFSPARKPFSSIVWTWLYQDKNRYFSARKTLTTMSNWQLRNSQKSCFEIISLTACAFPAVETKFFFLNQNWFLSTRITTSWRERDREKVMNNVFFFL